MCSMVARVRVEFIAMFNEEDIAPYRMSDKDLLAGKWQGRPCFIAESALVLGAAHEQSLDVLSMLSTAAYPFPDIPAARRVIVSPEEFEHVCGYRQTRSVVGICARPKPLSLEQLLDGARRILIIEDSSNGPNMAAMFRIAHAFGLDAVLVSHSCADPLFRRAARMSKGDALRVPWLRVGASRDWASEVVPRLVSMGFELAALALEERSIPMDELPSPAKLALVMGTEGEGLMQQTIELCQHVVRIPMRDGVDSLNVAAAAAVACWQATR